VSLVNAFNLIDVMDGLLCVVTGIAAIGLLAAPGLVSGATHLEIGVLLAGLAAFFLFNRPPAHIYAGDGGSMPLGFLIGAWILDAPRPDSPLHALARVGLCAAPALELLLLIPARLQRGLSPLRGSPDHFALRLQDQLGWSKRRVLAVTAVAGSLFALAPWLVAHAPAGTAAILAAFAITVGAIAWFALWRIPPRPAVPPAVHPRAVSK
jgi:UDP-GlcNAc:undecaprenyl-phosphate GlcNAc-1-phosphate transferase